MSQFPPCKSLDSDAFESLFHRYKNLVYRVAYLILEDRHEAEDALQEVFLQVYRAYPTYDSTKGAFTTWLYRITVNYCLKRRRKQKFSMLPLDNLFSLFSSPQHSTIDETGIADEVREAMARLSDQFRVVLILRYFSDLSYDEISRVLEIPIGTVKSRLARAIKMLQRELQKERSRLIEKKVAE
ncbi:MAG: RNA polymerase sigma factor [Anaerolineales bacterium]|nr:RNA polymerase sigma factor [Anaerolineales bacterium]